MGHSFHGKTLFVPDPKFRPSRVTAIIDRPILRPSLLQFLSHSTDETRKNTAGPIPGGRYRVNIRKIIPPSFDVTEMRNFFFFRQCEFVRMKKIKSYSSAIIEYNKIDQQFVKLIKRHYKSKRLKIKIFWQLFLETYHITARAFQPRVNIFVIKWYLLIKIRLRQEETYTPRKGDYYHARATTTSPDPKYVCVAILFLATWRLVAITALYGHYIYVDKSKLTRI